MFKTTKTAVLFTNRVKNCITWISQYRECMLCNVLVSKKCMVACIITNIKIDFPKKCELLIHFLNLTIVMPNKVVAHSIPKKAQVFFAPFLQL